MKKILVTCLALFSLVFQTRVASAQDQIIAQFVGSGHEAGSFPITTKITHIDLKTNGVEVQFSKRDGADRWPDTCQGANCKEAGLDMGSLQYSFGLALKVNGQWFASAPVETWFGNNTIGGQIQDQTTTCGSGSGQIHCNLFYDGRWAPLNQAHPQPGEEIGVFVVAGDARNNFYIVRERSNIVVVTLPNSGVPASFDFSSQPPPPPPTNDYAALVRQCTTTLSAAGAPNIILPGVATCMRAQGVAASQMQTASGGSDHKMWFNGEAWTVISSDGFKAGTFRWDPYKQVDAVVPFSGVTGEPCANSSSACSIPPPPPPPTPTPIPTPTVDKRITDVEDAVKAARDEVAFVREQVAQLTLRVTALESRPVFASCSAAINLGAKIPISCKLTQ